MTPYGLLVPRPSARSAFLSALDEARLDGTEPLSITALAKKSRVNRSLVNVLVVRGRYNDGRLIACRSATAIRLAKALGRAVDDLFMPRSAADTDTAADTHIALYVQLLTALQCPALLAPDAAALQAQLATLLPAMSPDALQYAHARFLATATPERR